MAAQISIINRLKKIALTSMELGREIAKEKTSSAITGLRESRAGRTLENVRQRLENSFSSKSGKAKQPQDGGQGHAGNGKRRLGRQKYSAKAARLSHV